MEEVERQAMEIGDFPRLNKRVIRDGNEAYIVDLDSVQTFVPRRQDENAT